MPNPAGLNTTTLHMKFVEPNAAATPLQGSLTFTPSPTPILFPTQNVIVAGTETATLDVNGEATIELISTDQADENPTGWLYTVTEKIIGQKQRSYNISLNYNAGVIVELSDITPTDAAPTYIPVVGPQGAPGIVTSVNGHSTATINLVAADLPDLIPLAQKGAASGIATLTAGGVHTAAEYDSATVVLVSTRGAANGVATLDGTTKIPVAQIPSLSATYVPWSNVEVANGVASLDASAKIKSTELNLAASAPPSVGTGAVGTSTNLARQDHTHDGLALTGAQSASGAKNFTTSVQIAQLGVGVVPGTLGARSYIKSTVDESVVLVEQTAAAVSNPLIGTIGGDSAAPSVAVKVTGDTVYRFVVRASGTMEWGSGSVARDTFLTRSGVGELTATSSNIVIGTAAPSAAGHATRKDYVDNNFASLTGVQSISGVKTFTSAPIMQAAAAGTVALNVRVTGDANPRLTIGADGTMSWGSGSAAADVIITRTIGSSLSNSSNWQSNRSLASATAYTALVTGDTFDRYRVYADGLIEWGTGNVARDTNLYRSAANVLKTDDSFIVAGGQLTVGTFGFYVISDWVTLASVGSFVNGAAAGTQTPKIRKVQYLGTEVWELQGQINLTSWTGSTMFSFTGAAASPYTPTQEHDFALMFGPGAATTIGAIRMYWNAAGNMGVSPTPTGTLAQIYLDTVRIINPLQV